MIDGLGHALARWSSKVKLYEDRTNTKLQYDLKITKIQNMRPGALRMRLGLNSARLRTSAKIEADIRR